MQEMQILPSTHNVMQGTRGATLIWQVRISVRGAHQQTPTCGQHLSWTLARVKFFSLTGMQATHTYSIVYYHYILIVHHAPDLAILVSCISSEFASQCFQQFTTSSFFQRQDQASGVRNNMMHDDPEVRVQFPPGAL